MADHVAKYDSCRPNTIGYLILMRTLGQCIADICFFPSLFLLLVYFLTLFYRSLTLICQFLRSLFQRTVSLSKGATVLTL
jgi:hypothetical protein